MSIDRFQLGTGAVGPITERVARAYLDVVRGIDKRYPEWRTRRTASSPSEISRRLMPGSPGGGSTSRHERFDRIPPILLM
ncbi:MAG: hypothetical protein HYR51_05660 [Candidatus Rokubacteria bacterium]|nr:hypothetical protein [Candidatus Rokubacteria bacterium]